MLDPLYHLAANAIVFFHKGFGPIFGADSFFAWALSVVVLVICVRILIFPLFVKQVKSQRTMQMMQPRIKEIREKYGHDKQRMQLEIMQLQKEHGNPLLGCLPILLQIPLFIALFHVFSHLAPMNEGPGGTLVWRPRVGLSAEQVEQIATAKLWGISLSTEFTSNDDFLSFLGANGTNVKIAAVVLILLMGTTTFLTQRQIMARTGPVDPQQAMIQKVLLYGSPIMLAVFGFQFPIAVLLYWLTTNLWSMGQQFFVIKKMPPLKPLGPGGKLPGARTGTEGVPASSRPAPGARAGAKSKNRPKAAASLSKTAPTVGTAVEGGSPPAGGGQQDAAQKRSAQAKGSRISAAPPGTRSPRGAAAGNGISADTDTTPTTPTPTPASASSPSTGSGEPDAAGVSGSANGSGTAWPNTSTGGEGGGRSTPAPVPGGVRRNPGGSRPAKRRSKGKRPGGRH